MYQRRHDEMQNEKSDYKIEDFLNDEKNLDIMTHLSKGLLFSEIAERIEKDPPFVQTQYEFLKKNKMMVKGQWNVNVKALGMVETAEFYEDSERGWDRIFERNFFLSYLSRVEMGPTRYLAMYTFPKEVENKAGSEITSWYYTFPEFKLPFFKNGDFEKNLERIFEEENNENPLPSEVQEIKSPNLIDADLIDIYLCRYVQSELEDINLKTYTERMKEEIGDLIGVSDDIVEAKFKRLKEEKVIYAVNPLDFSILSYVYIFFITAYDEIFRLMKALSRLNIITGISFMENGRKILSVHCPHDRKNAIADFLGNLDRESQIYSVTKVHLRRGLPYEYYLEKKKREQVHRT